MARTKRPEPPPPQAAEAGPSEPPQSEAGPSKRAKVAAGRQQRRPPVRAASGLGREFQPTFQSQAAEKRYKDSVVAKKMVYERGFVQPLEIIQQTIEQRGWQLLTKQPGAALLAVVREFYINAREYQEPKTLVRGKMVGFDSRAINQVFQLPDIPHDGLEQLKEEEPDYDRIIQRLATPAARWKMSKDVHLHFPSRYLHLEGKIWHYFIGARLTPSLHFSTVSKERALLIYAIVSGRTIDVGRIIEDSIRYIASGTRGIGLGHPSLIYELCLRSGVPTSPLEELQQPKPPITPELVSRLARERPPELEAPRRRSKKAREAATLERVQTELDEVKKLQGSLARRMLRQQQLLGHLVQIMSAVAAAGHIDIPPAPVFEISSSEEEEEEDTDDEAGDEPAESD